MSEGIWEIIGWRKREISHEITSRNNTFVGRAGKKYFLELEERHKKLSETRGSENIPAGGGGKGKG